MKNNLECPKCGRPIYSDDGICNRCGCQGIPADEGENFRLGVDWLLAILVFICIIVCLPLFVLKKLNTFWIALILFAIVAIITIIRSKLQK